MKHLASLNKFFYKYRFRFIAGIIFIFASNYFGVLAPQITGYVVSKVQSLISGTVYQPSAREHDILVNLFIDYTEKNYSSSQLIAVSCITILAVAVLSGIFLFLTRQTIIVMSRLIEYDQKNEVFAHYQQLDMAFYKTHNTGDLMNRISEDVSRVRMYTGPATMYVINLVARIGLCTFFMFRKDWELTLYVLAPLPILAIIIYSVNKIIDKKSERIQEQLSDLTTNAQESYSGIRVIKSFVQEKNMLRFFNKNSEDYKKSVIGLAKLEAVYFPSMALIIGISTLLAILIGSLQAIDNPAKIGVIVEFVIYINMLTFPVSAIGWTASMIQRAAASQKRLNEFLLQKPEVKNPENAKPFTNGEITFKDVSFTYNHTGINAIKNINLQIQPGEKIMILGKTGSGKSTLMQLLLRFYDPNSGTIFINNQSIEKTNLQELRKNISYVPQDVFLFSDKIKDNISFGLETEASQTAIEKAATAAAVAGEIEKFEEKYDTLIGERGVTLSGGQKQRVSIARALIKESPIVIFDDSLSAVDARTEQQILNNFNDLLQTKTAIVITHRIFNSFDFNKIIMMENGTIKEMGTHKELLTKNGDYAALYKMQIAQNEVAQKTN